VTADPTTAPGLAVERATWLPARTERVGEWLLGFTGGLTRRANSAVPAIAGAPLSDDDLARIEARYAATGQRTVFRICTAAPAGLDRRLAERGYAEGSVTEVWVRDLGTDDLSAPDTPALTEREAPDPAWLDGWLGVKSSSAPADRDLATGLLTGSPARYLTAWSVDGAALGVLRVGRAGDWAGLSCLAVSTAARRRGIGRALTLAGLRAAAAQGATRAFLQVEVHNAPAAALYRDLGFSAAERYVYRER
jgi:N-acetylglutamate synthase